MTSEQINSILVAELAAIELGAPVTCGNLRMFPLFGAARAPLDYLTLGKALGGGRFRVEEVTESGAVPRLKAVNEGETAVLLLDGAELKGAKQNRILNLTILISAQAEADIPVSCVEAGRWGYRDRHFAETAHFHFARGRAAKAHTVSEHLRTYGEAHSDQRAVWNDIAAKMSRFESRSATAAIGDLYAQRQRELEEYVGRMAVQPGQRGALFLLGGHIAGLDLFDSLETLTDALPKLVRSQAIDAIDPEEKTAASEDDGAARDLAVKFLRRLAQARTLRHDVAGAGEHFRFDVEGLAGGFLAYGGRIVHLCAFDVQVPEAPRRSDWEHLIFD